MPDLKKLITLEALQAALPSWLKSSSKPSYTADEISDTNTTNKFVTSADKSNWNAKGTYSKPTGGIPKTDLSSLVQSSLDKADSAVQTETDPTVPSWAKQTNKPSYTQDEVTDGTTYKRVTSTEKSTWNNKQSALTTTQMQAVNSGINSTKVGQISTNQTNILYTLNRTGKNLLNTPSVTLSTRSWNTDSNGYITAADTTGDSRALNYDNCQYYCHLHSGTYKLVVDIKTASSNSSAIAAIYSKTGTISTNNLQNKTGVQVYEFTISTEDDYGVLTKLYAGSWRMMICEADMYAKDTSYVPYALPNYDLTRLEAEDRAALAEEIDAGAKNKLNCDRFTSAVTTNGITFTPMSDGTIKATGTNDGTGNSALLLRIGLAHEFDGLIISGLPATDSYAYFRVQRNATPWDGNNYTHNAQIASYDYEALIYAVINSGTALPSGGVIFKPMICTKAAFGVSNKFVPYRPSWDLVGKDAMLSIQAKAANDTIFTFDISEYKGTASNRYRYGLLVGGYNASNPCLYHVFLNANNEATLTTVLPAGHTLTASTSGTTLTITASGTMYGGLRLIWLD